MISRIFCNTVTNSFCLLFCGIVLEEIFDIEPSIKDVRTQGVDLSSADIFQTREEGVGGGSSNVNIRTF